MRQDEYGIHESQHEGGTMLRLGGAFLGIIVILVGIGLAGYLFFSVLHYVRQPDAMTSTLDRWEQVLAGDAPVNREQVILVEQTPAATTTEGAPAPPQQTRVTMPFSPGRFGGALLFLLILSMLVRIAIAMIGAGGKLVALANPWQTMYEHLLAKYQREPTTHTVHRTKRTKDNFDDAG